MTAIVFNGEKEALRHEKELAKKVVKLDFSPRLVAVVFDEDSASQFYARLKGEAAERVGIEFERLDFSMKDAVERVVKAIDKACRREGVYGVMVQKPATIQWEELRIKNHELGKTEFSDWWNELTSAIDPKKDVDGLTEVNLKLVQKGKWRVLPATVKAVLSVLKIALEQKKLLLKGKQVTVVGLSQIFGLPFAAVAGHLGAKVYKCDALTSVKNLKSATKSADILVSATGKQGLIKEDMVKEGAIVIDVGEPKGDVDFEKVKEKAAFITPVPGGVGPMTVVSLLENLVEMVQSS